MNQKARSLSYLGLHAHYRTGERDPVQCFYEPSLQASVKYSRAVGYFRSTIFTIIGDSFVAFARRGGYARLICSPSITEEDALAISDGYRTRSEVIERSIEQDLSDLFSRKDLATSTEVLATLIKFGALDIRLAIRSEGSGIYHEKLGVFEDETGSKVSFLGSANETWSAWHAQGNHESIEVFRDWVGESEADRVASHLSHFERLWAGRAPGVDTVEFPEAQKQRLIQAAAASIENLQPITQSVKITRPRRQLLPHQKEAIENWIKAGKRGIFEHATGSGKTFTAISALKDHLSNGEPAIVVVPSQLLLEQWRLELEEEIDDVTLLLAGAGHSRWRRSGNLNAQSRPGLGMNRVVLATMQTAATDDFMNAVCQGDHLLMVADEVHQMGSSYNSRALEIQSGASMGLSATPERYGDPDGTSRIFRRFGEVVQPRITLQDAIKAGRLVEYEYHPHPINLNEEEAARWRKLTTQISFEIGRSKDEDGVRGALSEKARMLLIARSRIAKKARVKPGLAASVVADTFEEGQHWLVYCEDSDQLSETLSQMSARGLRPIEYHTSMEGDREAALDWFKKFGGILVSIKCLDEGIDIPAVSHAFILASSQNPRQFIQRRGRVLRKGGDKMIAVIHDAIVVPVDAEDEPDQLSLLKSELVRALEFSDFALNRGAGAALRKIAIDSGIEIDAVMNSGIEEEE